MNKAKLKDGNNMPIAEYMTTEMCSRRQEASEKRHTDIMKRLDELNARLYKDNGKLSIQTRLDRGDRIMGMLCWATSIMVGSIIVSAVAFVWKIVLHVGV